MKSVEEYNKRIMSRYSEEELHRYKTGVKCNYCEAEMLKTNPNMVLASFPPKLEIRCPVCGVRDYIYV
jgi:DNA-directed RNA polymerase subunit RPC12/RpoP